MNGLQASLAVLGTLALTGFALPGTTWHVDVNGAPPGDGSPGNPYTSIQFAIDQATTLPGDTVLVAPGTYVEQVDFLNKRIVVASTDGPLETTVKPPNPNAPWVVHVYSPVGGSPYARLEGFSVLRDSATPTGQGVRIAADARKLGYTEGDIHECIVRGHGTGVISENFGRIVETTITACGQGVTGTFAGSFAATSCIIKDNVGTDIFIGIGGSPAIASFTDFDPTGAFGTIIGSGNINQDPRFWDAVNGDFRLRSDSPCIDAGDPASALDPDGSIVDMGALTYDPTHAPGTAGFCFGSNAECPCANGGSGDGGCDIAQATGGIELAVLNFAPNGAGGGSVDFLGTGYPPASLPGVTLIRSPASESPPVVFGDGLRCIANSGLVRIGARLASGGTSLQHVSHGAGAGTFFYQVWVRNNPSAFCTPAAFNLSNGVSITWP